MYVLCIITKIAFTEINECERGISGCSQNCINTNGSFICSCTMGYDLSIEDQKTCVGMMHSMLYSRKFWWGKTEEHWSMNFNNNWGMHVYVVTAA